MKHTAEMDIPVHIPETPAMKKLVRDTQFNRLIRGEIETTKPEIRDLEWLFNHKHTLKMEFVTKRGIQFTCTSCGHKITRSRRQLARMFKNA